MPHKRGTLGLTAWAQFLRGCGRMLVRYRHIAMVVWEALDALSHQLELCKIDASSRVMLLLDGQADHDLATLLRAAISRSGASAIDVRPIRDEGDNNTILAAALSTADVVVTTTDALALTLVNTALNDATSARILVVDGHAAPQDYPPHANLRRRVRSLHNQLDQAQTLMLSDSNGTALRVDVEQGASSSDHGMFESDRTWVEFPAGWVEITPAAGKVEGDIVLMPGDGNLGGRRHISSPVRLEVVDDHVSTIHGDSTDADVIRALFEHPGETSAYGIAGVSIGLNPGRTALGPFDERVLQPQLSRLTAGVVTVSFGNNLLADRPCSQTLHLALVGRSVALDGLPIVANGSLDGDFAPDVYEL